MDGSQFPAQQFISGEILEIKPLSGGHIHHTYLVKEATPSGARSLVLQRMNHHVFTKPQEVINNMKLVSAHIAKFLDPNDDFCIFDIIPTLKGPLLYLDNGGYSWRMLTFIDGSYTLDYVQLPKQAYEGALAYGKFLSLIAEMETTEIAETIPNFHHLGYRYEGFSKACKEDNNNRVAQVPNEVAFVKERVPFVQRIMELVTGGTLPSRVVHNDTKLNNVLFSKRTDHGISVVDWDTIMPGYLMYDFGDMVRTFTSPLPEDSRELSSVAVQLPVFQALCEGFIKALHPILTASEKNSLLIGSQLMTFIMGLRFLTDYLEGDIYYQIDYPSHNLDRCRNQFHLLLSLEEQDAKLRKILDQIVLSYRDR